MFCRSLALAALLAGCSEYDVVPSTFDDFFEQTSVVVRSDVLFVIDDSPSMAEEQERLQANFGAFLDAVSSSEADYQVGVVTTDVGTPSAGLLIGGIFDRGTPMIERQLGAALRVGTDGSREEQGLEAALLALDGRNPGFPREDALLSIAVVSDEDDGSPQSVQAYLTAFDQLAGAGGLGVHGIVGDLPDGCATGTSAAAPGPRYIEAIAAVGGHRGSICADDYSDLLERVGLEVSGLPDRFALSRIPNPDSIEVFVDDVQMPRRELDGWTYDPGDNAIVFTGRAIPRPGMLIGVNYSSLDR